MKAKITFLLIYLLSASFSVRGEDLRKIVPLSGEWKFMIGDEEEWADPYFNDSDWDKIQVPGSWEKLGYDDYNGFAWYRRSFNVEDIPADEPLYLLLGKIDDADEVFINGIKVGMSGIFPPEYLSAYNEKRRYHIPAGFLQPNSVNTIAVRVYDEYGWGGITNGPIGIYVSEDIKFLDIDLSGTWKFATGTSNEWKEPGFDDTNWNEIHVPSEWESEGYNDYDGYAWYRKEFKLPEGFDNHDVYLSLGKIDDYDYVYLNGVLIGSVFDLKRDWEYKRHGFEFYARRIYRIPDGLLKTNGTNLISIKVYDGQIVGGIYEGPVGIMKKSNYRKYKAKYKSYEILAGFGCW